MGEFASNAKANAGLTTGIIGTTLGGLWALGAGTGGNGGLLNGLFGGGNANLVSGLMAENGMLKSENYADKIGKEVYAQSLSDNRSTEQRINALLAPTAAAIAENQKEIAVLKMQIQKDQEITRLMIENASGQTNAKIDQVASAAKCCCEQNSAAIAGLQALVAKITQTGISSSAICPEVMPRYNSWTAPTTTTPAA